MGLTGYNRVDSQAKHHRLYAQRKPREKAIQKVILIACKSVLLVVD